MTITAQELVRREVITCASYLISTIAQGAFDTKGDLGELCEQAFELQSPISDYESAAIDVGWSRNKYNGYFIAPIGSEIRMTDADNWQEVCEDNDIEPYEREVFEHWIVSRWFAEKLAEQGEKVDMDFQGLCIWARTTTGQAIYADSVIERITDDLNKPITD